MKRLTSTLIGLSSMALAATAMARELPYDSDCDDAGGCGPIKSHGPCCVSDMWPEDVGDSHRTNSESAPTLETDVPDDQDAGLWQTLVSWFDSLVD